MYPRLADELIEAVEINNMQVAQFPNICPETAQQHKQEKSEQALDEQRKRHVLMKIGSILYERHV